MCDGIIPIINFILMGITIMNKEEKDIIKRFEMHARSPDLVPHIMAKEQIAIMVEMCKDMDKIRKEIVQLRADIKQEIHKRMDDGK